MELFALLMYAILSILGIVLFFIYRNFTYWKRRGIPCTEPHLLWGNTVGWRKTQTLQENVSKVYNKYKGSGPFCGFYFIQRPSVLVLDTALAKSVLIRDFNNFDDRGVIYNERDDPLRANLFNLNGGQWKILRQKLTPTFSSGKMKFMFPTVVRVAEELIEVLGEMLQKSANVEVREMMARFTTDVICTCAFGIECNALRDPNAEFRKMGRMAMIKSNHNSFLMGLIHNSSILVNRLRIRKTHNDVHNFFLGVVRETVALREQKNIKRNDFMDLLIELKNKKGDDGLGSLTLEQVAAQAFVFFLAGFETSSTSIGFALYELACHPEWQNKLRTEVNTVLAKHDQVFTYECMKELRLMEQVLAETLRLHTNAPFLQRRAINDYVVSGHPKYIIQKGTPVLIPSAAFHHDPEYYPDPHSFKPERFSPEMVQQRNSVEWLAFGEGPRNCIGLQFGKMQARIGLAYLLKNFRFSVTQETQVPLAYDVKTFLLNASVGIILKVERI